jgi:nitroimidazol reductase NimA-like FMN-containing flavoprotein (pyridoxamine 5'-phosphate oxidase superfamily)
LEPNTLALRIAHRRFQDHQVQQTTFRLLEENVLCSLATVTPRGRAHIHTAYFAYSDEPELFFYSYPDSQHAKNIRKNPSMAVTIFSPGQTWGVPGRGMQLFGTCREAQQDLEAKAERLYGERFKGFRRWMENQKRSEGRFLLHPYRFLPERVKLFDDLVFGSGVYVVSSVKREHTRQL